MLTSNAASASSQEKNEETLEHFIVRHLDRLRKHYNYPYIEEGKRREISLSIQFLENTKLAQSHTLGKEALRLELLISEGNTSQEVLTMYLATIWLKHLNQ